MPNNMNKIMTAAALCLAASALLPIVRKMLRPADSAGHDSPNSWTTRVRSVMQIAKEEFEDIVAEAQFERMKKRLDREIGAADSSAQNE